MFQLSDKLNNIKISKKLPAMIVVAGIVSACVIGVISYLKVQETVYQEQAGKLSALLNARGQELQGYLQSIEEDLNVTAKNPMVLEAMRGFKQSWDALDNGAQDYLQSTYMTDQMENFMYASDDSLYTQMHKNYHPWFRELLLTREYYDIFLVDMAGNLIYSVYKEPDYATNLQSGKWKDTDLANAYKQALAVDAGKQVFFDFRPYGPSKGAPASFISRAVLDEKGVKQGVLVF